MPRRKNKEEHSEVIENVQSSKASKRRKGSAKKSTTSRRSNLTKNTKANLKGTTNSSKKSKTSSHRTSKRPSTTSSKENLGEQKKSRRSRTRNETIEDNNIVQIEEMESIDWQEKWDAFLVDSKELYIKFRPIMQYGMIVFSIFLGISLLSYDPMDLRSVHSSHPIANAGGILGAFLSKQLLAYLGFGAWSCLLIGGLQILSLAKRPIGTIYHYIAASGMLWSVLGIIALIHPATTTAGYYPSGIIGYETQSFLVLVVGTGGSWIFLLSMIFLLGIYIVGLDLEDAASQSLDQIQEVGPPLGYRTVDYFRNTYYDIYDGMRSIDLSFLLFWKQRNFDDDEFDPSDSSSHIGLADDIRNFVEDSVEEDSYEYSQEYSQEFSQEFSVEQAEHSMSYEVSSEYYSEEYSAVGLDSEEQFEHTIDREYDSLEGSFEELSDVVFTQEFSKKQSSRRSSTPQKADIVADYEDDEIAQTSIQKEKIVEVVWDPTIFSDPNLQETKARRKHQVSNPTTHESLVDIKTEDLILDKSSSPKHQNNIGRDERKRTNERKRTKGNRKTSERNDFHTNHSGMKSQSLSASEIQSEENWAQELSEWYIPEEDRIAQHTSEKYDSNPFKDVSEEIDLDQLNINDLKYEDDSFINQLFANLEAKKSNSVNATTDAKETTRRGSTVGKKTSKRDTTKKNKKNIPHAASQDKSELQTYRSTVEEREIKPAALDVIPDFAGSEQSAFINKNEHFNMESHDKASSTDGVHYNDQNSKNFNEIDSSSIVNEEYSASVDMKNDDSWDENELFYSEEINEENPLSEEMSNLQVQVKPISRQVSVEEDASVSERESSDISLDVIPDSEIKKSQPNRIQVEPGNIHSGGKAEVEEIIGNPFEDFVMPSLSLFDEHESDIAVYNENELRDMAITLENKFKDFNVKGEVMAIRPGPVITTFEFKPARGVRVSKIAGLADDIAMALSAIRVRIVAPIPGRDVVGIEIPNDKRQTIWALDMYGSKNFQESEGALTMCLGKTVEGTPYVSDLAKMPHLLVGGTTGSGKSVGINTMIVSLLLKNSPEDLRLILVDPKMLEFEMYHDIPHLIYPVVTDPHMANGILKWACDEMDRRYALMAKFKTRTIVSFNKRLEKELEDWNDQKAVELAPLDWDGKGTPPMPKKMPYIVVIIDELADLMMVAGKDVEASIIRLAQKARACGIHLIVATQRPSVDVITGMIKANMPSRISFQVRQKQDSRTILGENGGETLLGRGDMLFLPPGVANLTRCHGPFLTDEEVRAVTDYLRTQAKPVYEARIPEEEVADGLAEDEAYDKHYAQSVQFIIESKKASTSMIQRKFKIGYNRAARIIEVMESEGIVGPQDGSRPRKVLLDSMPQHLIELL